MTPTPTPTEPGDTPTPTATPLLEIRHVYPFDDTGKTLEEIGFSRQPETAGIAITRVPSSPSNPDASNGLGLRVSIPAGDLVTIVGPDIDVLRRPIGLSCWYYASSTDIQIGLGVFASIAGQEGAVGYAAHYPPELSALTWTNLLTEFGAEYTEVTPFIVLLNTSDTTDGTAYIENLIVSEGIQLDSGTEVDPGEYQPNLWLTPEQAGPATIGEDGTLILEKPVDKLASQFVAAYTQDTYPNRVAVELDMIRDFGTLGSVTLWIGTGPSGIQNDIPLWVLPEGESRTLRLVGNMTQQVGPMHVVIQISGNDNEKVRVTDVRVSEVK
jgi:hypothetical protein